MRFQGRSLLAVSLSLPALALANAATEAHSRTFGPQSVVRVARPTLKWEVWPGPGSRVTDAVMTLNGRRVHARYDESGRTLRYTPREPLSSGAYRVECKVVVDDLLPVKREWNFRVAEGAIHAVPSPTQDQADAVRFLNRLRQRLGLPPVGLDGRLCAAAMAHTEYLSRNSLTGHYQREGDPGFIGQRPSDRLDAFGFSDSSWEGVDYGSATAEESIQRLFDAPYHRIPFMQPGTTLAGTGFQAPHMTIEFGMSEQSGTTTSPADGEQGVPTEWSGNERPNPLRLHGAQGIVGYPVVFSHFTPRGERVRVREAELRTAHGERVDVFLNTPSNDEHLQFAAILIPRRPLRPGTTYRVRVEAVSERGEDVSRTWQFTTAG